MNRHGFTLLEVMLALALSSLVLVAVVIAIDVHLRLLDSGRTHVEEAQLARALLRRIADDLRGAVMYAPMEAEELVPATSMTAGNSAGAAGETSFAARGSGSTVGAAGDAGSDSADSDDSDADRSTDLAESSVPQTVPGLYGNGYELQVDTSRLPRIDQFEDMLDDDSPTADRVSEVKTVTYYVIGNQLGGSTYTSSGTQYQSGLVRHEMDRATTAWAADNGTLTAAQYALEPIAPEVAAIEFLYFDGTEWHSEWDTEKRGGLPVAVKIGIGVAPSRGRQMESASVRTSSSLTAGDVGDLLVYRLLVHLPTAQPTTGEAISETSEESSEDSGGSQPE